MRNIKLYLKDIKDAIQSIENFTKDIDYNEFKEDDKTSSAVIRKFEIIGEATKNIPLDIKNKYSEIPWKEMAGMRDILIHMYFGINYKIVWKTINKISRIKSVIQKILDEIK
jgi:uncharacterized protein with HEPN domain